MNILGIMSGTSIDGIDYVLCKEDKTKALKFVDKAFIPFTVELRHKVHQAAANELDLWSSAQLHYDLGEYYSAGLKKILKTRKWKFDLIGLHGQTVFHDPQKCTFQIGEASFLKRDFNKPVVTQFRNINIAYNGHGAPFAPFFHKALMEKYKNKKWAFQNIGGMANVTYMQKNRLFAFDTGPGNVLIDEHMQILFKQNYDAKGLVASKGLPHMEIVFNWLKKIKYFSAPTPKTCGRENISTKALTEEMKDLKGLSKEDQIATLTEFTVLSLKDQYDRFIKPLPELIVVSGGGAKNIRLMKRLKFYFPDSEVTTSEELLGWPVDAIEGGAFAWLALKRYHNQKVTDLPTVTGSKSASELGVLY